MPRYVAVFFAMSAPLQILFFAIAAYAIIAAITLLRLLLLLLFDTPCLFDAFIRHIARR